MTACLVGDRVERRESPPCSRTLSLPSSKAKAAANASVKRTERMHKAQTTIGSDSNNNNNEIGGIWKQNRRTKRKGVGSSEQ